MVGGWLLDVGCWVLVVTGLVVCCYVLLAWLFVVRLLIGLFVDSLVGWLVGWLVGLWVCCSCFVVECCCD